MKRNRRSFLKTTAAGTVAALVAPYLGGMDCGKKQRMNVIFLMSDQHRAMSMGAYGPTQAKTPNLDRFASQSVLFERAYSPFPQCVAARQSLLTGQYPTSHGCRNVAMKTINPDQWTVAHGFRDAGYDTVYIGKKHCNIRGFSIDKSYAAYEKTLPEETRNAIGGTFYGWDYFDNCRTAGPCSIPAPHDREMIDAYTVREAIDFLKRKHDKPFYLYVSFMKPHPPFNPPERFWNMYGPDTIRMPEPDPRRDITGFWKRHIHTHREKVNYLHGYLACISYIDWCLGEILKVIGEEGYFDNSIVSYTSDHGESAGMHGAWEKHCFYEPAVHVPLVIRTPDTVPARVKGVMDLTDVPVTQTDMCGITPGHQYDGKSLRRVLEGDHDACKDYAMSEDYRKKTNPDGSENKDLWFGRMLVEGDYKCCINGNMIDRNSLFNLKDDPREFTNLWDDPAHRDVRDRMAAKLNKNWRKEWWPYGKDA